MFDLSDRMTGLDFAVVGEEFVELSMKPVADKEEDVCEVLSRFDAGRLSSDNEAEEVGMFDRPGRRAGHQPGRPTAGNMSELLLRGSVINVKPAILSEGHDQLVGLIEEVSHPLSYRFRQRQMLQLLGAVFDLLKDEQGVLSTQLKSLRDSQSSILSLPFNLIDVCVRRITSVTLFFQVA